MKRKPLTTRSLVLAAACTFAVPVFATTPAEKKQPIIQLAILLDTSGSMSGLIDQAKRELWRIVNEFAMSRQNGMQPRLEVALYEYGNAGLKAEEGFVRRIVPLSNDLDQISAELFALTTNGGSEFCGQVIERSVQDLEWSSDPLALKTIFIAGNEPFTQGPVDYRKATKAAIAKGITVNTIFCGPQAEGIATHWKNGALLADGDFLNIDQNRVVAHVATPQDEEIARLGVEINSTYIPYGGKGMALQQRQSTEDSNALKVGNGAKTQRALTKASVLYCNSHWDLVDALKEGKMKLEELDAKDLPEAMRKMTLAEKKAFVAKQAAERKKITEQVEKLNKERSLFIAEAMKKQQKSGEDTLDSAIIKCIRRQGSSKNFTFTSVTAQEDGLEAKDKAKPE